jgi:membrane fusion protein (multidrug efflux system)
MSTVLASRNVQKSKDESASADPQGAEAARIGSVSPLAPPRLADVQAKARPSEMPSAPATPQETAQRPGDAAPQPAKRNRRKTVLVGAGLVALLAAGWYGYGYVTVGRFIVSTDDAYVGADMSIIAPKVAANVAEVPIVENQHVKSGDTLVRLDDGDYTLAVDQAAAKLATQKAALETFAAQISAAEATADQTRAQLDAAKATLVRTEADLVRTSALAEKDFSTKASLDAAIAARDSAKAQVAAGQAAIQTADANVGVLKAQRAEASRVVKELEVALAKAERDLSFTVIRAPFDGVVGNKSVQVGDYVTPGKRIASIVPLDKVYVDANLKETQLAGVTPGETAKVYVDALDGEAIEGTVESVAPASGSQFSLLPPENATGNFTKIVQRVPVRIAIPADKADGKLRPGLSVIVDIDTRSAPPKAVQHASN